MLILQNMSRAVLLNYINLLLSLQNTDMLKLETSFQGLFPYPRYAKYSRTIKFEFKWSCVPFKSFYLEIAKTENEHKPLHSISLFLTYKKLNTQKTSFELNET